MNFYSFIAMAIAFYLICSLCGIGVLALLRAVDRSEVPHRPIRK